MSSLSNKRILLGITGGIAAYKCAELTRLFVKAGAEVRVAMTRAATEFITALTMQALSGNRVQLDLLDPEAEAAMGHIELARWADLVLIAPATADFLAKLAHAQADDILSTLVLAASAPIAVAPAMNQAMWADAGTQANLEILRERKTHVFGPEDGDQACGDVGPGRMMEPAQLLQCCADMFESGLLAGQKIVITGGPTREALDPVRYISNHSSGKMAYALATEAVAAGARVVLISGPVNLQIPAGVTLLDVVTAQEMLDATLANVTDADVFIGVAAVVDYRPQRVATDKIKKSSDIMQLKLVKNPDIINAVADLEKRPLVVGFAAETSNIAENGREKLLKKKLDLLFANNAIDSFNSDSISVTAISTDTESELPAGNKHVVARNMLQLIADRLMNNEKS
ncbi:MAG: bifunctional phosphopantothenoylcysteine decarboxylase/phosphopantothenate--cysteine ligase CoaBC [Gammaproteobacteria bacterium]|nr:bifunctional phosphopantothenoylcysteine decarboxylase/phosphopantothenate--cysteine ligase CoaBC [Gammaproteobacteria bacterium]